MIKKIYVVGGALLLIFCSALKAKNKFRNELVDAAYYVGVGMHSVHIDLGKMELFFSAPEPRINYIPVLPGQSLVAGRKTDRYIFPRSAVASRQAKERLAQLNTMDNLYYDVHVKSINTPTAGLEVSITYDPQQVKIGKPRIFKKINSGGQWGVDFRFYNKALLDVIKKQVHEPRRVALLKKKELLLIADMGDKILGQSVALA